MNDDQARKVAGDAFTIAANIGDALAKVPEPAVATAGAAAAVIARIVQTLIAQHGAEETARLIERLHAERDKGAITDDVAAADVRKAHDAVHELYEPKSKKKSSKKKPS